ncbi:MAG: MarR family transcriptional regulator [Rhizonema sp. PD37]|nr:MarR family transcriptional regulator [Rhizonema sp. PD37]
MASSRSLPDEQTIQRMASRYPEIDIPSVKACLVFLDTSSAFNNFVDSYLIPHKLSKGKFTLLTQLVETSDSGLLPSEFAERAGVTRASVTSLLDGLERDKLITRQPHPVDRRMLSVRITDEGRELMNKILPQHFTWIKAWMDNLSDREKQTLIELLTKLRSEIPTSQKL